MTTATRFLVGPGLLLGVGLGGFADGIVLHQILGWHHMISSRRPVDSMSDWEANTIADGLFHLAALIAVTVGVLLLWGRLNGRPRPWPVPALVGLILCGWGLFNVVEGIVDHHILRLHHVRPGPPQTLYDIGFLLFGAALIVSGRLIYRGYSAQPVAGDG